MRCRKRDFFSLPQSKWILVAGSLADTTVLFGEMMNFRVKLTTAIETTFEAWRERDHDDLVSAIGVAAWLAERRGPPEAGFAPQKHQSGA